MFFSFSTKAYNFVATTNCKKSRYIYNNDYELPFMLLKVFVSIFRTSQWSISRYRLMMLRLTAAAFLMSTSLLCEKCRWRASFSRERALASIIRASAPVTVRSSVFSGRSPSRMSSF